MNQSLEGKWIRAGLGLAFLLMGAVSFVSYQNATQLMESSQQVRQTNTVLQSLTDISATLTEAESGQWRYILFQTREDLERYQAAVKALNTEVFRLQTALDSTPEQQQHVDALKTLITQRITLLQQAVNGQTNQRTTPQNLLSAQFKENQDAIRRVINELRTTEEELLQTQMQRSQSNLQVRMLIEVLGTVLTFMVLLGVYALLYQQMIKRHRAEALQQKLAQQKELSEMKLQFFSMVSHEFRTPLSLIVGSAQLLAESLKPMLDPIKLKNLNRIHTAAKGMTQVLGDMLTLARADAGRLEFHPAWVEMQTFCLNLIEDSQLFSETRRSIKFIQQCNLTHAWVDEKLLYSILSNLLSNAIKYSPPDSTIYFMFRDQPDSLIFEIKDEGIGIEIEDQHKLYDPFSRGGNARGILGTGLGLAIVKKCLDLHQGQIDVKSTLGCGSTFTVQIPQAKPQDHDLG
ncbi:ATP-binding protein [Leptolyngbya sp. FACHB-17]|uniref:sensor histidine kinase n=1 Tax=unclassified Leptolyngbya TaxID=2650499 RepID=UPI0016808B30|nr:ATP-binding protein [Leptolyngbya sp. FACHB-17]MBD2080213.1 CHASE3 domain-containing protein [Leptolyngbya sp. FACHB-17]